MTALPHNLSATRYRRAGLSGIRVYDHAVWMPVETSAGRDWDGSCYSSRRGYLARTDDGWLAVVFPDGYAGSFGEGCQTLAVKFPTLLRALSHVRPNRRRDFAR